VGNARRASPLSGGGSLRLPGQAFGDGPRTRKEGEGADQRAPRGPRTEAKPAPRGPAKRNGSGRS
jgi:23S rRNA (adenine2030-N6)-methyltransferase